MKSHSTPTQAKALTETKKHFFKLFSLSLSLSLSVYVCVFLSLSILFLALWNTFSVVLTLQAQKAACLYEIFSHIQVMESRTKWGASVG